jgi:hypothetical protein
MTGERMKKLVMLIIQIFSTLIVSLISGCSNSSEISISSKELDITPFTSSSQVIEGHIDVKEIRIGKSFVAFLGTADLPDGTILHSTLESNSVTVTWWPTDMNIPVKDSLFSATVYLNEMNKGQALVSGPQYYLEVWQEGNSSNSGSMIFDLIGPPPTEPWWKRGLIWSIFGVIAIIAVIVVVIVIWISRRLLSKNRK